MAAGLEGGCACGGVRYRLNAGPMFVHCCHCRDCQRQTGGAFAINALIEADEVEILSGETRVWEMPTDSGRPHDLHRCVACGTTLWSDYGRRRVMIFLRVATLDDATALPPDVHIFTRTRLPWVTVTGAPEFEIYYDMQALWPAASLARRRALLGDG